MFRLIGELLQNDYFTGFICVLFAVNFIIALTIIFLERKTPSTALAWIMVLFLLPVLGIVLYFFFSQNIARKQIFKLTHKEEVIRSTVLKQQLEAFKENKYEFTTGAADKWRDLIHLNAIYGKAFYSQNNKITFLTSGKYKYRTLMRDIENATDTINIQYFIIKNDPVGRKFIEHLTKKAKQGVQVRLLMDSMGSRQIDDKLLRDFIAAGGMRAYFFPSKGRLLNYRFNYRNHRKVAVIDGEVGYIGGFNMAREYLGMKKKFGFWRDTHIRVMGSCVQDINARFLRDWRFASGEEVVIHEAYYSEVLESGRSGVQIVSSGPDNERQEVKRAYMKMIAGARKSIYLQTPYLVPDISILESLKMAAQSGVDVRIMIPKMPDHIFVYWATYAYVGELIKSGCRAYIYDKGFLHAKTIVADGEVASVGSANFDVRSFMLNFEANAFIYDEDEAQRMEEIFERDMEDSHELTLELYEQRSMWIRFKENIAKLLSGIL